MTAVGGRALRGWRRRASAAAAGGLLVLAAWRRPDVALGLAVLGAVFVPLERRWPVVPTPVLRRGWGVDVVHFVVDQVLAGALVALAAIVLVPYLEPLLPNLDTYVHGPLLWVLAALIGEISGYWGHRAMHQVPCLWRLHSVHHSSPTMDWLAPNRRHVLDTAIGQAATVVPLLALGLSPPIVVGAFVIRRAQGLFVHANLRWRFPVVRWLIATPEFHHWHHSADPAHFDTNFAGQCPLVDLLFGTLDMPRHAWPASYGIAAGADPVPVGYLARLVWPFRGLAALVRRRTRRVILATAVVTGSLAGIAAIAAAAAPAPVPWRFSCAMGARAGHPDDPSLHIAIGPQGVVIDEPGAAPDRTSLRGVHATPATGLGLRVVRHGGSPLSIEIDPLGPRASIAPAQAIGAEGTRPGSCRRLTDPSTGRG